MFFAHQPFLTSFANASTSDCLAFDTDGLQRLVDYLTYKEATAKSKAKQTDVDALAKEAKEGWWAKNRSRFVK